MNHSAPRVIAWLAACAILTGCARPAALVTSSAPTPTAAPTPAPTAQPAPAPTAIPLLPPGTLIAGIDVGGLSAADAAATLQRELAGLLRPVELRVGDTRRILRPDDIGLELPADELVAEAFAHDGSAPRIPLRISYDAGRLRAELESLAVASAVSPTLSLVIDADDPVSRTFTLDPGQALDVDAALAQIDRRLRVPQGSRRITLEPEPSPEVLRPDPADVQAAVEELAEQWPGVVGVYVQALDADEPLVSLNAGSVFLGASTIKVAIMLHAYANLPRFSATQKTWLQRMIIQSDNLAANDLLAASVGGAGTEDALLGARAMSTFLRKLGLTFTYLLVPYEATDYFKLNGIRPKCGPADPVGARPYTETGPCLRATPAEMARIYIYIDACARGTGPLLDGISDYLTPARCREMLNLLARNDDDTRMRSGLPADIRVEHKSGWVPPALQADIGIVRSAGGDFVIAVYLWQPGEKMSDRRAERFVGAVARLVYSAFNPSSP